MADETVRADAGTMASSLFKNAKDLVEGAATGFLDSHKEVESFILACSTRLGKAMVLRWTEKDPDRLKLLDEAIEDEKAAILEETDALLKEIEDQATPLVQQILKAVVSTAATLAPILLKAAL